MQFHSWQGVLTSLFCEDLPLLFTSPFLNFHQPPSLPASPSLPPSPSLPNTQAHKHSCTHRDRQRDRETLLFLLPFFFYWKGDCATSCVILPNDMNLHMPSLGILILRPCGMFYATKRTVYRALFFASTLIWYHKHTAHTGPNRLTPM